MPLTGRESEKTANFRLFMIKRNTEVVLPHIQEASVGVLLRKVPLISMKPKIGVFAISIALLIMVNNNWLSMSETPNSIKL